MVVKEVTRKEEQGAETRRALMDAASKLFGSRGYADSSLESIVHLAGVTKGALYHHFSGKEDLFAAVFEAAKRDLAQQLQPVLHNSDPWIGLVEACRTYIRIHTDPSVQRIVLVDSRSVLSHEAWRRVDSQWGAVMFRVAFRRAVNHDVIRALPLNTLASILTGALTDACHVVANSNDPEAAQEETMAVIEAMLEGLRTDS